MVSVPRLTKKYFKVSAEYNRINSGFIDSSRPSVYIINDLILQGH